MAGSLRVRDVEHRVRVPQLIISFNFYSCHTGSAFEQRMERLVNYDVTSQNASTGRDAKPCASGRANDLRGQFGIASHEQRNSQVSSRILICLRTRATRLPARGR